MASLSDGAAPVQPIRTADGLVAAVGAFLASRGLRPVVCPGVVAVAVGGELVRLAVVPPVSGGAPEPWDDWPRRKTFLERKAEWDTIKDDVVAYFSAD